MNAKNIFAILIVTTFSITSAFTQDKEEDKYHKSIHISTLDLFRFSSPALKISYESDLGPLHTFGIESSIIYDFEGNISRLNTSERGIKGASLSFYYMKKLSDNYRQSPSIGFRMNYSYKARQIEKWVSRHLGSYIQEMEYTQTNNNVGLYLRIAHNTIAYERLKIGMALNFGYLLLQVDNNLPEDATILTNRFFFIGDNWFTNHKSEGLHYYPHMYGELNIGYTF